MSYKTAAAYAQGFADRAVARGVPAGMVKQALEDASANTEGTGAPAAPKPAARQLSGETRPAPPPAVTPTSTTPQPAPAPEQSKEEQPWPFNTNKDTAHAQPMSDPGRYRPMESAEEYNRRRDQPMSDPGRDQPMGNPKLSRQPMMGPPQGQSQQKSLFDLPMEGLKAIGRHFSQPQDPPPGVGGGGSPRPPPIDYAPNRPSNRKVWLGTGVALPRSTTSGDQSDQFSQYRRALSPYGTGSGQPVSKAGTGWHNTNSGKNTGM
jgi:hypothetical protein